MKVEEGSLVTFSKTTPATLPVRAWTCMEEQATPICKFSEQASSLTVEETSKMSIDLLRALNDRTLAIIGMLCTSTTSISTGGTGQGTDCSVSTRTVLVVPKE